jgi:hypothetical protein
MRQITYPAALGSCCALGGHSSPLQAAEWTLTPTYSSTVDYNTNQRLLADSHGTDMGVITADLLFKHAVESLDYSLEPRYAFRRFTDSSLGNGDDRSIYATLNWTRETTSLNLTGSYWDQSTLTTELLETGIVSGDTHRRLGQAAANWVWNQTEVRSLLTQFTYLDVSYHGEAAVLLPGYRYPSGLIGERFLLNERTSFTFSVYGSELESDTKGNSSHSVGLQAELVHQFTERTQIDASVGRSSRVLAGESNNGLDASISLTHTGELSRASASYTRSLVPYGFGYLVERQQYTLSFTEPLSTTLNATLTGFHIQNNQTAVLLRLDRPSYDSVSLAFNWRPLEHWSLGGQVEELRSELPPSDQRVHWVRVSLTATWAPQPKSRSW